MSPQFTSLVEKLKEIFQIDKPELDFGIYRILRARRTQIEDFLNNRLAAKVQATLAGNAAAEEIALKNALQEAIENAKQLGIEDPNALPKVRELKEKLAACSGPLQAENEVYSHLLTFFSRYYDKGDFISQRRYKGDTYAIPYSGEEVKLHWANADQYYVKSGESFSHYDFSLPDGAKVHFRLVSADITKDNIKDNDAVRCFVLWDPTEAEGKEEGKYPSSPIEEKDGELYVYFQYRRFKKGTKQKEKSDAATTAFFAALSADVRLFERFCQLDSPAPTEKDKHRKLFRKYLDAYTAKNTSDYFIHKDLQGFLSRELDFYIKNEMMHLDDIQHAFAFSQIEKNLRTIQAVRIIAMELIDFMAQIENFQKKLWLKKKFVVQCDYCLTMDLVPEELHAEVLANPKQQEEWNKLNTTEASLITDARMVDTKFFDEAFKAKLLASIENLDEFCRGTLVRSENTGFLSLSAKSLLQKIKVIYIDPPYNTGGDGFCYKDSYQHSSWLSMMQSRMQLGSSILCEDGVIFISIDEKEHARLKLLADEIFDISNHIGDIVWEATTQPINAGSAKFALQKKTEVILVYAKNIRKRIEFNLRELGKAFEYPHMGKHGPCRFEIIEKSDSGSYNRPSMRFTILGQSPRPGKRWQIGEQKARELENAGKVEIVDGIVKMAVYPEDELEKIKYKPFWSLFLANEYGTAQSGKEELNSMFENGTDFDTVKPSALIEQLLFHLGDNYTVMDFFAGSGTTAQATIRINSTDEGKRKYILTEMGDYFDTLLLPRVKKSIYSPDWKDGKPVTADKGISHCFKYMSLESYEDTLNNIELQEAEGGDMYDTIMQEQYLLKYMLDIESRGSIINTDSFRKPFDYRLKIAVDSSGASEMRKVDLVETFNYLLGLHVETQERHVDKGYMMVEGRMRNGAAVLIVWRDCDKIGSAELNNLLEKKGIRPGDSEFATIYVNGDHSIANKKLESEDDTPELKVRSIEEEFLTRMFEGE